MKVILFYIKRQVGYTQVAYKTLNTFHFVSQTYILMFERCDPTLKIGYSNPKQQHIA